MLSENVSVQWRPRNGWEAIDLGVSLLRQHATTAYLAWWSVWLPLAVLLAYGFRDAPGWAFFLLWWAKPLAERPVVWQLGHLVFGERLPFWRVLRWALSRQLGSLVWHLSLGRLRWSRGFSWPVWLLEEAPARIRRQRLAVLARRGIWFTRGWMLMCFWGFESMSYLGLHVLAMMLWPGELWAPSRWRWLDSMGQHAWLPTFVFFTLAMGLVGPLFIAGGFGHYLSRRCDLEGWDIELGFRRLAERLTRMGQMLIIPLLLLGAVGVTLPSGTAYAAASAEQRMVEEEAQRAPYRQVEENTRLRLKEDGWLYRWLNKKPATPPKTPNFQPPHIAFPALGKLMLYFLLLVAVVLGALLLIRQFSSAQRHGSRTDNGPEFWHGDPRQAHAEPLPTLLGHAQALWAAGQIREALGLLYLGGRRALAERHGLAIDDGDTEGDLIRRARQLPRHLGLYFSLLARTWQATAYAHRLPDAAVWQQLTSGWHEFIAGDPA